MIGVDTNVLVRACLEDSPTEARVAKNFLFEAAKNKQLFISSYAILEMVWVLKVKGKTRQQITDAVLNLLDSPGITVGQRDVILNAIEKYRHGKADFGDYLILSEGAAFHTHSLATFDKILIKENDHIKRPDKHY